MWLRVNVPIKPTYHISPLATSESNFKKTYHNFLLFDVSYNEAACYLTDTFYCKSIRFVNIELSKHMCDMCLLTPKEVAKKLW